MRIHSSNEQVLDIPWSGLVGFYDPAIYRSFTNGSTTFVDLSTNAANCTFTYAPTYDNTTGGLSLNFGTTNDNFGTVTNNTLGRIGNSAHTIITFYKNPATPNGDDDLISTNLNASPNYGVILLMTPYQTAGNVSTGYIRAHLWTSNGLYKVDSSQGILSTSSWRMIAQRYNNSNILELIHNGSVIGTNTGVSGSKTTSNTKFFIGNRDGTQRADNISGNLGVILVYNRALTDTEVTQIWTTYRKRYGI